MTRRHSIRALTVLLALFLVAASPAGVPQSQVLTLVSPNEEHHGRFGFSVAGLGDVNQDGIADVVVGAVNEDPGDSPEDAGRAYVLSVADGGALGELASPNEQADGAFGVSLANLGDVDQDGSPDLVVGASGEFTAGRTYVLRGRDGSLLFELASPNAEDGGSFGASVANAGDVDQDGLPDVIVGAPSEGPNGVGSAGRAYVFSAQDGRLLYELVSPNETRFGGFGGSVAGAGDVDRDGAPDLIVGAANENFGNSNDTGRAYVFSGVDGNVLFQLAAPVPKFERRFGKSVAGTGDVNQDGFPDLIVGEPGTRTTHDGHAYVFSGEDTSLLFEFISPRAGFFDHFGWSVAGAGDVNQDGFGDFIVGATLEGVANGGRAHVFSGLDGSFLFQLSSPNVENGALFGSSVAGLGDVNQDGLGDLVVGANREDPGDSPQDAGRAYVFLSPYPFRVNCGGTNYTDVFDSVFAADRAYAPGGFGYVGGVARQFDQPIGGTDDDPLYQDVRVARQGQSDGIFSYRFDVPPGLYDVTLYLMAPELDGPGNVVMDVKAEEDVAFDDLDVTAEAGGEYQALAKTFVVDVQDGTLDLRFRAVNKAAVVSAIAVAAQEQARRPGASRQLVGGGR